MRAAQRLARGPPAAAPSGGNACGPAWAVLAPLAASLPGLWPASRNPAELRAPVAPCAPGWNAGFACGLPHAVAALHRHRRGSAAENIGAGAPLGSGAPTEATPQRAWLWQPDRPQPRRRGARSRRRSPCLSGCGRQRSGRRASSRRRRRRALGRAAADADPGRSARHFGLARPSWAGSGGRRAAGDCRYRRHGPARRGACVRGADPGAPQQVARSAPPGTGGAGVSLSAGGSVLVACADRANGFGLAPAAARWSMPMTSTPPAGPRRAAASPPRTTTRWTGSAATRRSRPKVPRCSSARREGTRRTRTPAPARI